MNDVLKNNQLKKEDLTCPFHGDVEISLTNMRKRLDILIFITIVNALLSGGTVFKYFIKLF